MMPRDPVLWYAWALLALTTLFGGNWLLDAVVPLMDNEASLSTTHEPDERPLDPRQLSDTARSPSRTPVLPLPTDRSPERPPAERECALGLKCS